MRRSRLLVVVTLCGAGLVLLLNLIPGVASARTTQPAAAKVTVITVSAGLPSELQFKLSKLSKVPAGTVTFKVTNKGTVAHDFRICTTAVKTSKANTCVGKTTPMLASGKSATLTVTLSKTGTYEFLGAVPGHAAAGMKGLLGIGVAVAAPAAAASSSASTSTGSSSSSSSGSSSGSGSAGAGAAAPTSYPPGNATTGKTIF